MLKTASARNWNVCVCVFEKFSKYRVANLLGEFIAKVGKENISLQTFWCGNLHEINNDNGVKIVNFATSKNLAACNRTTGGFSTRAELRNAS
jgi:hypothetical protein